MNLIDRNKIVTGIAPVAMATTAGDADYVSMKGHQHLTILLSVKNGTTVTGCAVTLKQATAVAGTSEKALAFDKMWANIDAGASDTLVETAVTSNTFTTDTTNSKDLLYVMEIEADDLDVANGFDCVRLDGLLMANAVGSVTYVLSEPRYSSGLAISAITD